MKASRECINELSGGWQTDFRARADPVLEGMSGRYAYCDVQVVKYVHSILAFRAESTITFGIH